MNLASARKVGHGRNWFAVLSVAVFCLVCVYPCAAQDDLGFGFASGMGGVSTDLGQSIAVDAAGNVYITGRFSFTADFDPGPNTATLTSAGGFDVFVQKLNAAGGLVWARAIGGTGIDVGIAVAVDGAGNVYTTGCFTGTADFDPGPGVANLTSAGGTFDADVFVSKLDFNGNFVWAKGLGGADSDWAEGIAVDAAGNVYTTGSFFDAADFDPGAATVTLNSGGGDDIYVSKLDSDGNFLWAVAMGGTGTDVGTDIAVDAAGGIYTTGSFQGTADFDPGGGVANRSSAGSDDIFVVKLTTDGNFIWASTMGGTNADVGLGIAVDGSGNAHTTGFFQSPADFDPGAGTRNLAGAGGNDIFVSKLDFNGNYLWAKGLGGPSTDVGEGIAVDAGGSVYTTGFFRGKADFNPGAGSTPLTSAGDSDIFVSQLDSEGNLVHAKAMGGLSTDVGESIAVDAFGSVYTTGFFSETADFDPRAFVNRRTSAGAVDIFASQLILSVPLSVASRWALGLLALVLLVAGCASIVRGRRVSGAG